ncbi:uncharacterized protein LOC144025576 isoform X1 [Festucalex cinctus]
MAHGAEILRALPLADGPGCPPALTGPNPGGRAMQAGAAHNIRRRRRRRIPQQNFTFATKLLVQEEAENACLLPLQHVTVQKPSARKCLKSFFCEAEKALNTMSPTAPKPNEGTCQKNKFCKAVKALTNTTGNELATLAGNLHAYNEENGVEECHLTNNTKYHLCQLLEDIARCAKQRSSYIDESDG